jgi:hypothetical protein
MRDEIAPKSSVISTTYEDATECGSIQFDEIESQMIDDLARHYGVSGDELIRMLITEKLARLRAQ